MLYIISAPSGGGKTSLVRALILRVENLIISISHTTRPPRPGEIDGVNYHFVSSEIFSKLIQQNIFLEYAEVFGHFYGTSREWVLHQIQAGKDIILEIDWQGAEQLRKLFPQSLSIFIMPPSLSVLRSRLKERGQDSKAVIEKRMQEAKSECIHFREFDYLVINDDFDIAVSELETIIRASRLRCEVQFRQHQKLLENLLLV